MIFSIKPKDRRRVSSLAWLLWGFLWLMTSVLKREGLPLAQHSHSFGFLGARIGTRDRDHYESKRGDGSHFLARDHY
jgi:hypothetical protein